MAQWRLSGQFQRLQKSPPGLDYSRLLGGWLTTYGQIADDGSVVPTEDRQGQIFEAAKQPGNIDWSGYLNRGWWNDAHDRSTIIGRPLTLNFHDGSTDFGKEHRKVGWYSLGTMFDRNDPKTFGDYKGSKEGPSDRELERSDELWNRADSLGGLGFSVDGMYLPDETKKRIVYAVIDQAALHPTPHNPDAVVEQVGMKSLEVLHKSPTRIDEILKTPKGQALIKMLMEFYGLRQAAALEFLKQEIELRMKQGEPHYG